MNSVPSPNSTNQTEMLIASLEKLAGELNGSTLNGLPPQAFELLGETLTELQHVYRQLQRQADSQRQFEAIQTFAAAVRDVKSCAELGPIITSQIAQIIGPVYIAIIAHNLETGENTVIQTHGTGSLSTDQQFAQDGGPVAQVIATGKPYLTANLPPGSRAYAAMVLPLVTSGKTIGALWLKRSREFSDSEIALMMIVADIAAPAMNSTKYVGAQIDVETQRNELEELKTKFINDMSHELRTPVTGLNMTLYLLERNGDEKYAQYLSNMREDVERLTDISESILDTARLETQLSGAQFEQLDFNALVSQLAEIYELRAQRVNISWSFSADEAPLMINGDQGLLIKAVGNLLTNAFNYSLYGQVAVYTAHDPLRRYALLIVENTGLSIDSSEMPHVFERFYRGNHAAESAVPGAGLGLSSVKAIVDLHQGKIEAESVPEQKTRFTVYLPLTTG